MNFFTLKNDKATTNANKNTSYFNLVSLVFFVAYLAVDFLPYFGREEIIKPQFLYLNVLNILVAIFIYFNPLICSNILAKLKNSYAFKAYLFFVLICSLSVLWAKNSSLAINGAAELLVVLIMLINFVILFNERLHLIYKVAFLIGFCAFFQVLPILFKLKSINDPSTILDFLAGDALKGNTGNMNILAASLMIKLPFILIGISYFKRWGKFFFALVLTVCLTTIFLVSARTPLLSLLFVLIALVVYFFQSTTSKKNIVVQLMYVIIPLLLAYGFTNHIFKQVHLKARFTSTLQRYKEINVKDPSAKIRLDYWKNTIKLTKAHALLGVGLGNYRVEVIPYEFSDPLIISLHSHNDFLEVMSETGVLNGLIYLSVFIVLLFINIKRALLLNGDEKAIATLALMLGIVYFLDAFFNFPMFRPTMQLGFCFLMAFTILNTKSITQLQNRSFKLGTILFCFALLPLYVVYFADQTSLLESRIRADGINVHKLGKLHGDEIIDQQPKFPNVLVNSESFDEYAGIYFYRKKEYQKATTCFDKANQINPYLGRPDFFRYLIAKEMGNQQLEYTYIKEAVKYRPISNFYSIAVKEAIQNGDSIGLVKLYKQVSQTNQNPVVFDMTVSALKKMGLSEDRVNQITTEANR